MSRRLTKKSDKLGYCLRNSHFKVNQCWNKLGQLEDVEEEIGIDLITLYKALENGIWCKLENGTIKHYQSYISNRSYGFVCIEQQFISYYECYFDKMREEINFYFKDYGVTWALTKEELK